MDIGWLQDFLTLADMGNFTRAAEKRNSSQAAFSRRVQSLEVWLGTRLFDRTIFPICLTAEGERFREQARDILSQVLDARISVSQGMVSRHDHVSIALPHALATGRFTKWWTEWSRDQSLTCEIEAGNIGDAVNAMISGAADILIYYHNSQQPLQLDELRYEQIKIGTEQLRPYGARHLVESGELKFTPDTKLPLLMYGPDSYLARVVDLIFDRRPHKINMVRVATSSMSSVLREMAADGHGIAWLPDAVLDAESHKKLALVGDKAWSMSLTVMAYRDRSNDKAAVFRLWNQIKKHNSSQSPEFGVTALASEQHPALQPKETKKPSMNAA